MTFTAPVPNTVDSTLAGAAVLAAIRPPRTAGVTVYVEDTALVVNERYIGLDLELADEIREFVFGGAEPPATSVVALGRALWASLTGPDEDGDGEVPDAEFDLDAGTLTLDGVEFHITGSTLVNLCGAHDKAVEAAG